MRRNLYFLNLFFLGILSGQCQTETGQSAGETIIVKTNPRDTQQPIEGWGSSLCWWAGQVGNWEESKVDSIVDLITSPDKLNMNIFRYNIGGGDDPSHADGHMVKGKGKRAEMEGFKTSEDAPYQWDADKAQRTMMLKIKEKRPDAVFEAFSNSPPYWMTFSGCSAGNADPAKDNLKPEYYEAFCDYLVDVCKHYKEKYGLEFKTLEPFNESVSNYWYYLGSQEGCHYEPETQMEIIRILYSRLKASGLKTVISASDETNIASFIKVLREYQNAGDILDKVDQLNTHTYSGTNDERREASQLVKTTGKTFWQSETGPGGWRNRAAGLENNLLLAQKLFNDMSLMQPQAWLDWQLMEEGNDIWCLIKCDFKTQEYNIVKNFYVRQQITRFFKQGYSLIKTGHESALAAVNPEKNQLVVAVNNTSGSTQFFKIDMYSFEKGIKDMQVFRTSADENCQEISPVVPKNQSVEYTAPAKSLTTFVLSF